MKARIARFWLFSWRDNVCATIIDESFQKQAFSITPRVNPRSSQDIEKIRGINSPAKHSSALYRRVQCLTVIE
jgi:hypothetical protein